MNIDTSKTLEQLENKYWKEPEYNSRLVITCHNLRKKPLEDFGIEDLRIMIGQNISLEYLIPLSIDILTKDILSEGNLYEGDLLTNVLSSDKSYWMKNSREYEMVCLLFMKNQKRMKDYDIAQEIKLEWFDRFKMFKKMR